MRTIPRDASNADTFRRMIKVAQGGVFTGTEQNSPYFESCRWWLERFECIAILTRDTGYHSCGWWKNPDYERCYHLSVSFPGGAKRRRNCSAMTAAFSGANRHTARQGSRPGCGITACFVI